MKTALTTYNFHYGHAKGLLEIEVQAFSKSMAEFHARKLLSDMVQNPNDWALNGVTAIAPDGSKQQVRI